MKSQQPPLTDKAIIRLPYATSGQYKVRDAELGGFFVQVGKRSKTYMVEGEFWRHGVREIRAQVKLGDFGDISTREARGKAKEALASIARGERPGDAAKPKPGEITLRAAWERYRDAHLIRKGRDEGTIRNYRDHIERLLADWLDHPLSRLGRRPAIVAERHEKISADNGRYAANGAMRSLRAVYNHALKSNPDLPPINPVKAVDWNPEVRRDTGMGDRETGRWLHELHALDNAIRREFHLLTLLTGSRPTALKHIRIEHIDLRQRIVHIPKPKGGVRKAFGIPLSRPMIRCMIRAMRLGRTFYPEQAEFWLFPADSVSGHLIEHKEDRDVLSKWGNDLRQSYRTLAQVAGVSELDVHLLMNHSLPGVNAGYITRDRLLSGHLRKQQERISQVVMDSLGKAPDGKVAQWLRGGRVEPQTVVPAELSLAA
ncbi:integrase arm-type DNA-binding domain-containing protein [Phenylobacterium sp.]|uniref:integrase arm-type DNA-binding domain-containing protein n=1 Tax=Phenylobacterium sp. TaxID=1871053 RepID=UPI003BA84ED6